MHGPELLAFLVAVALGSGLQAFSGFGMALVVLGTTAAIGLKSIQFTAAVVTILMFAQVTWVLRDTYQHVNRPVLAYTAIGLIPGVWFGLVLLGHMSESAPALLRQVLGAAILAGGVILVLHPHPRGALAGHPWTFVFGFAGGVLGGMFGAAGPAVAFHLYRQPLAILVIRSTLLAVFAVTTLVRIVYLALRAELTFDVLATAVLSLPAVLVAAAIGARLTNKVSPAAIRRLVFVLLAVLGVVLIVPRA